MVGAGGHAKVVIATARASAWAHATLQLFDDAPQAQGRVLLGVTVQGPSGSVLANASATAVLALGDNQVRARLAATARCSFATLVHQHAVVDASVVLGAGTVVFAGAIVQPDTMIGEHTIINTGASVDHDCVLGAAVHIAPGARLAGGVTVGPRSFVGIGAVVIPGVRIGADVKVGAGAAVVRDVPDGATVVGVPAQPLGARRPR